MRESAEGRASNPEEESTWLKPGKEILGKEEPAETSLEEI